MTIPSARSGSYPRRDGIERRLTRQLTTAERKRLKQRLRAEGPDKVADAVLELPATKLSAWLAAPNGHNRRT